jgi:hypothetical protein
MSQPELKKITAGTASEVYALYGLDDEIACSIPKELTPAQFIGRLVESANYSEAVKFLSYALPRREATWLACLAAKGVLTEESPKAMVEAVQRAEKWVYQSSEKNRRAAMQAAETAGFNNPAGLAAAASAWSGGSLAPEGSPEVPPPDDLTAKAVWGCLALAAFHGDPTLAKEKYHTFLTQGLDIANGGSGKVD